MRQHRYREIADDLRARIESGEFAGTRLLPSESTLSHGYEASRVTVRKALEQLRGEGRVDSRQGFGWFVAADPVRQSLARLGTIEEQLAAQGVRAERRILDFGFVRSPRRVAAVLGTERVLAVRRLNLADDVPFARVTVWVPDEVGAELSRADVSASPFYELLPERCGIVLGGATQTIGAGAAGEADAALLDVPLGSPVLRCERITSDTEGRAVLMSVHVFPALRTEFVVDLPTAGVSMAPSGLRLVE